MQGGNGGQGRGVLGWALALLMSAAPAAAQEYAGREKLRAQSS